MVHHTHLRHIHVAWKLASVLALALTLAAGAASQALAEEGQLLGYAKSSSMTANTTNVINGTPQPGTLLPLNSAALVVRSIPLGTDQRRRDGRGPARRSR